MTKVTGDKFINPGVKDAKREFDVAFGNPKLLSSKVSPSKVFRTNLHSAKEGLIVEFFRR